MDRLVVLCRVRQEEKLNVTLVGPELVVEVGVYVARDASGRWQHTARWHRARPDLSPADVPRWSSPPHRRRLGAAAPPTRNRLSAPRSPAAFAPPIPPSLILNSSHGMDEGGRNGDVSGPTTPYDRGDQSGLQGAAGTSATPTATLPSQ
ncbi:hypothetical protein GCM10010104_24570 [Streptomyces indiaensis]|uniref:Uncharacterized protein n=1 Tax=Streptomyces indiaensis TaxID=284033 RepID=A0ABN3DGE9_9ACTN